MSKHKNILVDSVALTGDLHGRIADHLLRFLREGRRQEMAGFGLYTITRGATRTTALVHTFLPLQPDEFALNGNVWITAEGFLRGIRAARTAGAGLVFMHNHLSPGWQGMSDDDNHAENRWAPVVLAGTDLPFLGMTFGTDGACSARSWNRVGPKCYQLKWCSTVRVVGPQLRVTYHPTLRPPPAYQDELRRTISVWGQAAQEDLTRLHVGVIGAGSTGMLIVEALARMGVGRITLIDFDRVEPHNLDRLLGATRKDAKQRRLKVSVGERQFYRASTAVNPVVRVVAKSVTDSEGFGAALDCDMNFLCVDRPWPRHVANFIAYAHLIPLVEGGIIVRTQGGRFRGAEWSARTVGPGRACLRCAGAYDPSMVDLERRGLLDDPHYIQGLDEDHLLRRNENIFPFSMNLASMQMIQFIALTTGLLHMPDLGDQRFYYNLKGSRSQNLCCAADCEFSQLMATGDTQIPREAILNQAVPHTPKWQEPTDEHSCPATERPPKREQ